MLVKINLIEVLKVYDPYQIASLEIQIKQKKKKNIILSSFVGMIVAVAGIYVVDIFLNLLEKKKLNEILNKGHNKVKKLVNNKGDDL